jgi:hypothetical protein
MRRIDAFLYAAGIIGVGLIAYAWPVRAADVQCSSWPVLKAGLARDFHEVEVGGGWINPQAVMVVLMSPGGDTWTIAALGTDGQACIVSAGKDWFQRSIPSPDERPS